MIVCPLHEIDEVIAARGASHLVSLLDPSSLPDTPKGISAGRHLKLGVNDITEAADGLVCPDEGTVDAILEFGATWPEDAPMVVHCWAGISRSTATAFILACERNPKADERAIARAIREAAPWAYPNRRLVALADDKLGRSGRMVEAVRAMGPPDFGESGEQMGRAFDLPARF